MDKQREEFEKSYMIPDNLMFDGWEYIPKTTGGDWEQAREYTMRYQAWQAAQAAMQPEIDRLQEADKARLLATTSSTWLAEHDVEVRRKVFESLIAECEANGSNILADQLRGRMAEGKP